MGDVCLCEIAGVPILLHTLRPSCSALQAEMLEIWWRPRSGQERGFRGSPLQQQLPPGGSWQPPWPGGPSAAAGLPASGLRLPGPACQPPALPPLPVQASLRPGWTMQLCAAVTLLSIGMQLRNPPLLVKQSPRMRWTCGLPEPRSALSTARDYAAWLRWDERCCEHACVYRRLASCCSSPAASSSSISCSAC